MGDLAPRTPGTAPVVADDDNSYKAVQAKLTKLASAMDDAWNELDGIATHMKVLAARTDGVATDITHAGLDPRFVVATNSVATALDGAHRSMSDLYCEVEETTDLAHRSQRTHARLYRALDDLRSNRRAKTPKPGFFAD
ncbi:conjugal transfer protein TraB [Streptomyces sp. CLI2509]|uniref:conjugal transfer protein TraB n=2 Tax=unclassified Streptomyces TaxID=2593676 RepID=UPI000BACE31E|nr:conjugal transfer protein TraB [Streptomyces sp. CLI2509]ASY37056.1 conjugal transfer protein TraB [Streptomyces sp. CLI2509]